MSLRTAPLGQLAQRVRARMHDGVPVFTADVLDGQRAALLRATASQLAGTGPFLVQGILAWTDAGLAGLCDDRRPVAALVAPPAGLLAAAPGTAPDVFPSVPSALAVLHGTPGPLPLLPIGADSPARWAHRVFPAEPTARFGARHWIRGLLADWSTQAPTDRALVAFSELTAASVATGSAEMHVSVYLWRPPEGGLALTVGVRDDSPALHLDTGHGRESLRLVAALSAHLGRYRQTTDPAGKVVWFTIPVTTRPPSGRSR